MLLYYNDSVDKTKDRYVLFSKRETVLFGDTYRKFRQFLRRKQMKKRFLSALLAVAVFASLMMGISLSASAARQIIIDDLGSPMSRSEMEGRIKSFLTTADGQIIRDDYQNMPEGMQTKGDATIKLEQQIDKGSDIVANPSKYSDEDVENFLIGLFGEWNTEARAFADENKPYGDFQDAYMLRYKSLDKVLYWDKETGYAVLKREEYTVDSWNKLSEFMDRFELEFLTVLPSKPYTGLAEASRSTVYYKLQEYYALVNQLIKYDGDLETNRLRGLLYDTLNTKKTVGLTIDELLGRADSDDTSELAQKVRKALNLGDKQEALKNARAWYEGAKKAFNDPNATAEDIKPYLTLKLLMTDSKNNELDSPYTEAELEAEVINIQGLPAGEERTEPLYELSGTVYMKKSQKRENGQPVFDENGDPVFDYARTTYHYNYSLLRDQLLDNVNRCSFLNNNYRIYKHVMYYEAEKNNQNGGAFEQSKWTDFLSGFALGDLLLSEPTATESTFYMALEDIVKAYEKFSQVQYLVEAYDSYGKSIIEYYKENFITEKAQYEESLTSDDYFNTEVYDIDGLRAFRRVLLLYIEAMQKLSDLEANGQKDSSDYKFWAEIAKARVVDLVVAKATMPFTVHEEDDDGDGTIRFFRNDQQILNMAQQIVEKAKEYYKDIMNDLSNDPENRKYPFQEDDAVTFGEDITKLEGLVSRIAAYEKNVAAGNYQTAEEADAEVVTDEQLLNALNNLYFDMTNMQLEYYYE